MSLVSPWQAARIYILPIGRVMRMDATSSLARAAQGIARMRTVKALGAKNAETARFGLALTAEDAELVADSMVADLKDQKRVELAGGIAPKIVDAFCDSPYLIQETYAEVLCDLQSAFYLYKGEAEEAMDDDELLALMRECFDEICNGDVEYLAGTCLERFARAIRAGYDGFHETGGERAYWRFDEETRWDADLYLEALRGMDQL